MSLNLNQLLFKRLLIILLFSISFMSLAQSESKSTLYSTKKYMKHVAKQLEVLKQNILYPASMEDLIEWKKDMQGKEVIFIVKEDSIVNWSEIRNLQAKDYEETVSCNVNQLNKYMIKQHLSFNNEMKMQDLKYMDNGNKWINSSSLNAFLVYNKELDLAYEVLTGEYLKPLKYIKDSLEIPVYVISLDGSDIIHNLYQKR